MVALQETWCSGIMPENTNKLGFIYFLLAEAKEVSKEHFAHVK